MLTLLLVHAAVGFAVLGLAPILKRWAFALAAVPAGLTLATVAAEWDGVVHHKAVPTSRAVWVEGIDLVADARLDGFALLMATMVAGMGVVVMGYGSRYFAATAESARIAGLLVLFGGSMLGLVMADNLIWIYACWELTSITSYLLIGRSQESAAQRAASLQALLVTGAGGLAMLGGFVMLASAGGTWSLQELLASPPDGATVTAALVLVLAGIFTKSAQYPFHFWLPGAMVAPTPISAYLHSATMVKAGVYLAARMAPGFADTAFWRPTLIAVGLTTMIAGALRALRQDDLKLLLAFGTVSQLGFMMVLAGSGHPKATKAVVVLLVAHALFKGALFLVVGIVDHDLGTRDRNEIALTKGWTVPRVVALVSAASMAGLPPVAGFIAKESAYEAFVHGTAGDTWTLVGLVVGSTLTFAYSARFAAPFLRRATTATADLNRAHSGRPSPALVAGPVVLAVGTVLGGLAVAPMLGDLVKVAANSLDPDVGKPKLALWHGFNQALGLSALAIVAGLALVAGRATVERVQERLAPPLRGDEAFAAGLRGMNRVARRVTGTVQPGSLPLSIGVILVVVIGAPTILAVSSGDWSLESSGHALPIHHALAALLAVTGLAVALVRRRFAAVLLLGAVGFAMALFFAVQGAPDLALTQFAVETLSIVVFMLVVRHLPVEFRPTRFRAATAIRAGIATVVGVGVFVLAMLTNQGVTERPVSDAIVATAEPDGGGKNVVNVILVDVRGLDTLGEVTVLAVAAVGVVALARVGRGRTRSGGADDPRHDTADDGAGKSGAV